MIRFITISKEETLYENDMFCWLDTVTDNILEFKNETTWNNWDEFEFDFMSDPQNPDNSLEELNRFKKLYQGEK